MRKGREEIGSEGRSSKLVQRRRASMRRGRRARNIKGRKVKQNMHSKGQRWQASEVSIDRKASDRNTCISVEGKEKSRSFIEE